MDNWTRQFYENEIKEIYKPEKELKPEKKLMDEIREDISFKNIKSGLGKTLKKILFLFLVVGIICLVVFGGMYVVLKYFMN